MPDPKAELTALLKQTAVLMELRGDNPFRCRAFANGARVLEAIEGEPARWMAEGTLEGVKGIGKGLMETIEQFVSTGRIEVHDELRNEIPDGLIAMLHIPGLGAKKIKVLWRELGIETIEKLEEAARSGAVAGLPGFGPKSAEKILAGIEMRRKFSGRRRLNVAFDAAEAVRERLEGLEAIDRLELAGSMRRGCETIKDLDFVAAGADPEAVMDAFIAAPDVERVVNHGPTKSSIVLAGGVPVDLRVVEESQFAAALHYSTGSKEHNTRLRGRAKAMGLRLNEYGLFEEGADRPIPCKDEAAIYRRLGLRYIEPELREDRGEIEAAEAGELPSLITRDDMRGMLHVHSTYSDGKSTLERMAEAARALGYEYIGLCDHSRSAAYAGGLGEEKVLRQHEEIDRLNARLKNFRILKGIESDILAEGELDYPDDFLARFDFIVISVHSRFQLGREKMTARILRAIAHPAATILGHPTGRLLLERDPYEIDMDQIIEAAARHRVAIEINANPARLDLDWRNIRQAKKAGCVFAINPDAHHVDGLADVRFGIGVARKGWLEPADVVNTFTLGRFQAWLGKRGQAMRG